jgi:signal transduction histidine kinase
MQQDYRADLDAVGRIEAVPVILDVVCRATGMGFAAIARVTEDRWIACATRDEIGLQTGGELDVTTTICNEIPTSRTPVIIDDVEKDPQFCDLHTPAKYGFRSYISMPIFRADGSFFGTLCAIDPKPAHVSSPGIASMFRLFANLIGFHLDSEDRLAAKEKTIAEQNISQNVRDQFIAVLGHDLRNPLASIDAGMKMLEREPIEPKYKIAVGLVRQSVKRMAELIDNVLDFARGRLGAGMTVNPSTGVSLQPVLQHVVDEMRLSSPQRDINGDFDLKEVVTCDPARVAQMLSNLMANAVFHGATDGPVIVTAKSDASESKLVVCNTGEAIPREVLRHLFEPFSGELGGKRREGLGLGLYICAEIARAHGGRLEVRSDAIDTRFAFTMPQTP